MNTTIRHPRTGRLFVIDRSFIGDNTYHGVTRAKPTSRRYIVVHHTAGSTAGDLRVLRGKTDREVSVKFLVPDPEDGHRDSEGRLRLYQLLRDDVIGWSIGATTGPNGEVENTNSDSIEVSNRGDGSDEFEAEQTEAVEALIAWEERRLDQDLSVFGHRQVAPGRKVDPHPGFDLGRVQGFSRFARRGRVIFRVASPSAPMYRHGKVTRWLPRGTRVLLLRGAINGWMYCRRWPHSGFIRADKLERVV